MTVIVNTQKNDFGITKELIDYLEMLPCAAYLVSVDRDLTIYYGNALFYRLLDCTQEDMRNKYGGRLGALVSSDSFKSTDARQSAQRKNFELKQQIKRNGKEIWIHTAAIEVLIEDHKCYLCTSCDITQNERAKELFGNYEEVIGYVMDQADFDVFKYDLEARSIHFYSNHSVLSQILPSVQHEYFRFAEMLKVRNIIHTDSLNDFEDAINGIRQKVGKTVCELRVKTLMDEYIWVRFTSSVKEKGIQADEYAIGFLEDITQQKEAYLKFLNETQVFQAMLTEKDAYGQFDITEDQITMVGGMWNCYNEGINRVSYSVMIKEYINKVVHPDDHKQYLELMQRSNFIESLKNGIDRLNCEVRCIAAQNKILWVELSIHLFKNPVTNHTLALICIKNIDAGKRQGLSNKHDIKSVQLTDVFNKERAERAIGDYLRQVVAKEHCAFMILHIDNFDLVNETYGHAVGDIALEKLTELLRRSFREYDIVSRFKKNEFIIFLKSAASKEQVKRRLNALYTKIGQEKNPEFSCSVGIALICGPVYYQYALEWAEKALYFAKSKEKGSYAFYQEESSEETFELQVSEENDIFDTFLSKQGDLAYLVGVDTYDLICGNQALYDRIGLPKTECNGKKCYELLQGRESPCPFCSKVNWSSDRFYLWRNYNDNLKQEFMIKNKLVQWQGQEVMLAISIDISNNKSIVDSVENGATESYCILNGVRRMAAAESLTAVMYSALESIGHFFDADSVRFWERSTPEQDYLCTYMWDRTGQNTPIGNSVLREVKIWLKGMHWGQSIIAENPEAMMKYSYSLYQLMKDNNVKNQRWLQVKDGKKELGCLVINNISSNLHSTAFLDSFIFFIADEIKKRSLMAGLIYANQRDELTGLLSRSSYEKYLTDYRADSLAMLGVVVADFDQLKEINSDKGFHVGNDCLREFAHILELEELFEKDAVFRLNGDEFLIIAANIDRISLEERICLLENKIKESGAFSVSIGYSWDDIEKNLAVLIEQSTVAMKINKRRHYDTAPAANDSVRYKMLSELVAEIENNEFEVFLQPKVEFRNNTVMGAEALIRYKHKTEGYIAPIHFIGKLEDDNLIRYVDLFVFEEVCKMLERWKQHGVELPVISVNFSRLTLLERNILSSMEAIIAKYDVPRVYIEIEITESVSKMGKSILHQAAADIRSAGFSISLDDFGTEYTNLAILAEIDFDVLKLDKSLISALGGNQSNQIILKNVIHMCKELHINVIAEGVETKAQENIMYELGCMHGQGYLYGKPVPIEEFEGKYIDFH